MKTELDKKRLTEIRESLDRYEQAKDSAQELHELIYSKNHLLHMISGLDYRGPEE